MNEPAWRPITDFPDTRRKQYLEMLRLWYPDTYKALITHSERLPAIEIQILSPRKVQARYSGGQPWNLFPSAEALQSLRADMQQALAKRPPLYFLAGPGYGPELDLTFQLVRNVPETVVLVVERDPLVVLLSLCLHDWPEVQISSGDWAPYFEDGAIVFALGDPVENALADAVQNHALYLAGSGSIQGVFGSSAADDATRGVYIEALKNTLRFRKTLQQEAINHQKKFVEDLNKRPERPTHVWSSGADVAYVDTPILQAMHRGLAAAGLQCTFTHLPSGRTYKYVHQAGLVDANPDTLLFINTPTRGYIPQGNFHRLVWVTDDPNNRIYAGHNERYADDEQVFYADPSYEPVLIEQGARRPRPLPPFALLEREGRFRPELNHPLVYVGIVKNLEPHLAPLNAKDRDSLAEMAFQAREQGTGTLGLQRLWEERGITRTLADAAPMICRALGRVFTDEKAAVPYLTYIYDTFVRRLELVRALLPLGLHVYGTRDWQRVLGDTYADRCHGFLGYDELPDVYRSADIVINIHSLQLPVSLNIRDFDVLRSGGCMLADPVAGMTGETILPGRDCETAVSASEFADKAAALLADPTRRQALAMQGQRTVLERHLPEHRAGMILSAFEETD